MMDAIITPTHFSVKNLELLVSNENKEKTRFYRYYKIGSSTTVILLENNYVLRISDFNNVELYNKFKYLLPRMYQTGNIYSENDLELGYYFLVERIYDYEFIENLSLDMKLKFLKELLVLLLKLEESNLIYRDLKLENIGFIGPNPSTVEQVKILDFDEFTILTEEEFYTKKLIKKNKINWFTTGTYPPLYILKEHILNKLATGGLVMIILQLFYGYNPVTHLIHSSLSYNLYDLHKIINDYNKFIKMIEKLEPLKLNKECDLIIKKIIIKLFSLNTKELPKYEEIYISIIELSSLI